MQVVMVFYKQGLHIVYIIVSEIIICFSKENFFEFFLIVLTQLIFLFLGQFFGQIWSKNEISFWLRTFTNLVRLTRSFDDPNSFDGTLPNLIGKKCTHLKWEQNG
jgi:hypothetical protein